MLQGIMNQESTSQPTVANMAHLRKKFRGDPALAMLAYSWGEEEVEKWQSSGGDPQDIPQEHRKFMNSVMPEFLDGSGRDSVVTSESYTQTTEVGDPSVEEVNEQNLRGMRDTLLADRLSQVISEAEAKQQQEQDENVRRAQVSTALEEKKKLGERRERAQNTPQGMSGIGPPQKGRSPSKPEISASGGGRQSDRQGSSASGFSSDIQFPGSDISFAEAAQKMKEQGAPKEDMQRLKEFQQKVRSQGSKPKRGKSRPKPNEKPPAQNPIMEMMQASA